MELSIGWKTTYIFDLTAFVEFEWAASELFVVGVCGNGDAVDVVVDDALIVDDINLVDELHSITLKQPIWTNKIMNIETNENGFIWKEQIKYDR